MQRPWYYALGSHAPTHPWTPEDSARARSQGWDLFDVDQTSYLEIQKLDEFEGRAFDSDDDAFHSVFEQAVHGDRLSQLAVQHDAWHRCNEERPKV